MRIFIDLDGTLCDYYGGVCEAFGFSPPWPFHCQAGKRNFFLDAPMHLTKEKVQPLMGYEFYANLRWLPDGPEILSRCEDLAGAENVYILTSPWSTRGCSDGKNAWILKHIPKYRKRVLIGACKAACSAQDTVLVDDSDSNCRDWLATGSGGIAPLLPRPWNSRYHRACSLTGRVTDLDAYFGECRDALGKKR